MDCLREGLFPKSAAIAVLEQVPDAEKTLILVKARRLAVSADSNAAPPSYMQGRVGRGEPLPQVAVVPVTGRVKKRRQFRTMLAFLVGMRVGPEGKGMPRDVFRVVLDLLMPTWDPLRRGVAGAEMPLLD